MKLGAVLVMGAIASTRAIAGPAEADPCLAAQVAIERVRARHLLGAAAPSERELAESARMTLESWRDAAARRERTGGDPVTPGMLDDELDRIARETRLPARLREIYESLDNDPLLIRECLLRPMLEERLARGVHQPLAAGVASSPRRGALPAPAASPGIWDNRVFDAPPEARELAVAVWTGSRVIIWGGGEYPGVTSGGIYDPFSDTWEPMSNAGAPHLLPGAAGYWTGDRMLVFGAKYDFSGSWGGGLYDPGQDSWSPMDFTGAPSFRSGYSTSWVGDGLIVWGGSAIDPISNGTVFFGDGARYDPLDNSWSSVNPTGAPSARTGHSAVWTGSEMIVWGGKNNTESPGPWLDTGGAYDLSTGLWRSLSTLGAPPGRSGAFAVWTGSEMLIWSGYPHRSPGGLYDPAADTWRGVTPIGEPEPIPGQRAVWTGSRFAVLGGELSNYPGYSAQGLYDPGTDHWETVSAFNDPSPRTSHVLVSFPGFLFVWGGNDERFTSPLVPVTSGGLYDLAKQRWSNTSIGGGPPPRGGNAGVWTGNEMIIWGGAELTGYVNTGSAFDPALASWRVLSTKKAPSPREKPLAVWTGSEVIIWGGTAIDYRVGGTFQLADGARYNPVKNKWKKIKAKNGPPGRYGSTAVWTGREMILWGGAGSQAYVNEGARYDPVADTWRTTSTFFAPKARQGHSAAWTGTEVFVWGGYGYSGPQTHGGRYDPVTNTWRDIPPDPNAASSAPGPIAWTGSEMIHIAQDTTDGTMFGGRFDPVSETWSPIDLAGAPRMDPGFLLVWTGDRIFAWGGGYYSSPQPGTGVGIVYDPASDAWVPLPLDGAPDNRAGAAACWTGSEVLIWGGMLGSTYLGNGAAFTPAP